MKRRIISIILNLAMCLSMLPTWAWAVDLGSDPDNTTFSTFGVSASEDEEMKEPENDTDIGNGSGDDVDSETDNSTQDGNNGTPGFDPPVIETSPVEEPSGEESEIKPTAINPDLPDAEKVKAYFSKLSGIYATKRHMTDNVDRADVDWSISIDADGDIALLYKGTNTGAMVAALTNVNADTGAPASMIFSNPDKWYTGQSNTAVATLTVTWNAANRYFTMQNNLNLYWDSDNDNTREHFYFSSTPQMYNEAHLKEYFDDFTGTYPLNDGSGWSVEIANDGMVFLHDGNNDSATANTFINNITYTTANPSVVNTVVFASPDWYNNTGTTNNQTLTLTWNPFYTWNSGNYARNEFTVSAATFYTSAGNSADPWKAFTTSHFFTGKNWSNEYLKSDTGAYDAGAGNDNTDGWKLEIDANGCVWLCNDFGKLNNNAPARLNAVTGTNGVPRVSTMTAAIPGWYANTSYNTPGIITLTWQADTTGAGIARFTTGAVTLHRPGDGGQDETLYIPILYFDHNDKYTVKSKNLLKPYVGKYTLDDGSGWYAEITADGGVMLSDGKGREYRPYYYNLSNPLSDAPTLTSIVFRDAEWYNASNAGYQTLTLYLNTTVSTTYSRLAFCSNASGAALTAILYNADATVQKNFNGARFTASSWANEYFKGNNTDTISYTGTYDVGAGYGEQYPQVKDWKLEINSDGYVWLKNANGNVCNAPATLTAVTSTTRSTTGTAIPRVSTMLIAVPGCYSNAGTKQQGYLTLTWQADNTGNAAYQGNGIYRFTTGAATLYDGAGNSVYFPAMYFTHNEKYTAAAKGLLKNYAGEYKINDGSGWSVTVAGDGSVTLYDDRNEPHSPYYYTLTNPLNDTTRALSSVTFGDKDWFTNNGTTPQTLTLTWAPATERFTAPSVILYDGAQTVLKSFTTSVIFSSNKNIEKAKAYLKDFSGKYPFNDGSDSAVEIKSDGSISIKLAGVTNGFIEVDYTPTFTTGKNVDNYVSTVQIPIPGWYASSALNSPAYLTLTWAGDANPIVNHYFTNSSTTFYKTATEYKVLSAGRFYSKADMGAAAAYLKTYAGVYRPRVSDAWYAVIDGNGYVAIHTKDADGKDLSITPALNITNAGTGAVNAVYAVLPGYAANRDNRDTTYVNAAPQVTLNFTVNANSPYFAPGYSANSGITLYSRTDEGGNLWPVTNSTTYKTSFTKLYPVDRAYSDANKQKAKDYFNGLAGNYVIDDGYGSYKITVKDGEIFWSDNVNTEGKLLAADVNFGSASQDVPSSIYVWYNGYYGASNAADRGNYNVFTFTQRGDMTWNSTGTNQKTFTGGNATIYQEGGVSLALSNVYHYIQADAIPGMLVDGRYFSDDRGDEDHWIDIVTNGEGRTYLFDGMYPLTLYGSKDSAYLRGKLGTTNVFAEFKIADEKEIQLITELDKDGTTYKSVTYYIDNEPHTITGQTSFIQNNTDEDGKVVVVNPGQEFEDGQHYHYLAQAVAVVEKGGTIYLTDDNQVRVMSGAFGGKDFTIDGQGHTITRGQVAGVPYTGTFIRIGEGSNVTLKNVTIDGGGKWDFVSQTLKKCIEESLANTPISANPIEVKDGNVNATGNLIEVTDGSLTLVDSEVTNFYSSSGSHVFDFGSKYTGGKLTVNNSKLNHNAGVNHLFAHNTGKTTITLNNGTKVIDNYTSGGNGALFYMNAGSVLYLNAGVTVSENVAVNSRGTVADAVGNAVLTDERRGLLQNEPERLYSTNGVDYECSYIYINGAEITENIGLNGGGQPFYIEPIGGLTMNSGKITDNTGAYCGAIWSNNNGVTLDIVIRGGEIHDNKTRENGYECIFCMGTFFYENAEVRGKLYLNDGRLTLSGELKEKTEIWIDGSYGGLTINEDGIVNGDIHVYWGYIGQNDTGTDFFTNNGTLNGSIIIEDHTKAANNGTMDGDVTVSSRSDPSGDYAFENGPGGDLKGNVKIAPGTRASNEGRIDGKITVQSDGSYDGNSSFDNLKGGAVEGDIEVGVGATATNEGAITGNIDVKADGELCITGDGVVNGDITVYPGGELRSENFTDQTGNPHVNGKITFEYEDDEDRKRMEDILDFSGITCDDIVWKQHQHTTNNQPGGFPATCTTDGISYNECGTCGRQYNFETLPATGHNFKNEQGEANVRITQIQDCTHDEILYWVCSVCGFTTPMESAKFATGHIYVRDEGQSTLPGVNADGYDVYVCEYNCGASYTVEVPPLSSDNENGHVWDLDKPKEVITPATCTSEGSAIYGCKNCSATITLPTPRIEHTIGGDPASTRVNPNCTDDGYVETVKICTTCRKQLEGMKTRTVIPATGHIWGQWDYDLTHLCTDKGNRTHKCLICGATATEANARAIAHTWSGTICTVCGATRNCNCKNGECICMVVCNCKDCSCNKCPGMPPSAAPGTPGGGSGSTTYPPTITDTKNGSVSVSPKAPQRGDNVTIVPEPDDGYGVGNVVVKDHTGNELNVKNNGNGTFSFTQPGEKVTIEVTFVFTCDGGENCPSRAFIDLDTGKWYHEATDYVIRHGLMNGYGNEVFGPNNTLTRAMLAQILYNQAGGVPVNYLMQYDDVPPNAWYTEAVRWAASEGVVNGYGNGKFGPNDPIIREQLAVMLYRYEQRSGGFTGNWMFRLDFTDAADISDWAYEAACWCNMNGIINGKGNGILDPKGQATRAEAAAMLMRFLELNK